MRGSKHGSDIHEAQSRSVECIDSRSVGKLDEMSYKVCMTSGMQILGEEYNYVHFSEGNV